MAKYYTLILDDIDIADDTFSFDMSVTPQVQLQVTGHWDTVLQYQYDVIKKQLIAMAKADPLNDNGEYIRDYDYIDYYMALVGVNLENWLVSNPVIPNDIKNAPLATQIFILQERIAFCQDLQPILQKYEEGLRWNVNVTDSNGITTAAVIQPGGWFRNQADDYSFSFLSTKSHVGIDDLPYVTMVVRINNG